jgi:hypothetical protein
MPWIDYQPYAVESMCQLLDEVNVLQQDGPALADGQRVLVIATGTP